jgi:DNA-binding NarL/FixJ family response regulator
LSSSNRPADILREAGPRVRGRLSLHARPDAIRAAIEAVAAGLVVFDRLAFDRSVPDGSASDRSVFDRPARIDPSVRPRQRLSVREIEVLRLVAEGLPNKAIAWRLDISEHTAKFHVASILDKLDVASRAEAVREGLRLGLILL